MVVGGVHEDPAATESDDPVSRLQLDRRRQSVRRIAHLFWTLAKPYWRHAPGAKFDLARVVFLGLLQSAISVLFSYVSRDFWTALQKKDVNMFWRQIIIFSILLLIALPILVWYSYAKDCLALRWRQWHTKKLLGEYFAERNFYEIDQRSDVDNVDQRICEDTSSFTSTSLSLFMTVFMSTIDLINFSVILMTIYPKLFLVLILYSGGGTVLTFLLGRRLISLNFTQLQREADFRFSVIRVRENAESIAFYNGESREKFEIERRFSSAVSNLIDLITWSRNLAFFTTFYSYMIQILPLSVIAPLYFQGHIELGVVSQSQQAFRHILDDLSLIISQFGGLSAFGAGIDRLGELEEFLYSRYRENVSARARARINGAHFSEEIDQNDESDVGDFEEDRLEDSVRAAIFSREILEQCEEDLGERVDVELLSTENGFNTPRILTKVIEDPETSTASVEVNDLTLMTPDSRHRVLFQGLNVLLRRGQRMLIVGSSGTGKSSFLRALAGLWSYGHGSISRPTFRSMFFLPQKPYCTLGSLREQLVYPKKASVANKSDDELQAALDKVDLSQLPSRVGGLDTVRSWATILSLGEQQRLAFARLLIGKPAFAILDESTSALDLDAERRLYNELRESDTTYISVGHRPSLIQFHNVLLRIGSDGQSCTVTPITGETSDTSDTL